MPNFHTLRAKPRVPQAPRSVFQPLTALLLLVAFCSGCAQAPHLTEKVKEPPYIPAPPEASANQGPSSTEDPLAGLHTGFYADLLDPNSDTNLHPLLKDAVTQAVRLRILKPIGFQEQFDPGRAVTYGEFRGWIIDYQKLLMESTSSDTGPNTEPTSHTSGDSTRNSAPKSLAPKILSANNGKKTPSSASALAPESLVNLMSPMSPEKLRIPPSTMEWTGHQLAENTFLTRQELCALYVFLSHQDEKARQLNQETIENASPPGPDHSADEALGQIKDYANIHTWAQRYVAIAYQDKLLQTLFQLTPNNLSIDDGFLPLKAVTRGDAMILLYLLYGKETAHLKPKAAPSSTTPPVLPLAAPNSATSSQGNAVSSPLKRAIHQNDPALNAVKRKPNALQINGPD